MAVGSKIPIGSQLADRQLTTQSIGRIVDINLDILVEFDWCDVSIRRVTITAIDLLIALTLLTSSVRAASGALDISRTH
jgi:hypothetical protein